MEPDHGDKNSLAAEEPGGDEKGSALPTFAAQAGDLEAIRKAVDDAASVGGGLWLSYLFVSSRLLRAR